MLVEKMFVFLAFRTLSVMHSVKHEILRISGCSPITLSRPYCGRSLSRDQGSMDSKCYVYYIVYTVTIVSRKSKLETVTRNVCTRRRGNRARGDRWRR